MVLWIKNFIFFIFFLEIRTETNEKGKITGNNVKKKEECMNENLGELQKLLHAKKSHIRVF